MGLVVVGVVGHGEQHPVAGVEAVVQEDCCHARVGGESAPRPAHGADAEILCHVEGEQRAGDLIDEKEAILPPMARRDRPIARALRGGKAGDAALVSSSLQIRRRWIPQGELQGSAAATELPRHLG